MFSTKDYIELISGGVDAGLVSLVEGAYKCLFETAVGSKITAQPIPYFAIAEKLGIDIKGCVPLDDFNNEEKFHAAVERRVTENPAFKRLCDFVDRVLEIGIDYAGIGYRDSNGIIRYNYPEMAKNPELRTIMSNFRQDLIYTLSSAKQSNFDSKAYAEAIGMQVGHELRHYLSPIVDQLSRKIPNYGISAYSHMVDSMDKLAYVSRDGRVRWISRDDGKTLVMSRDEVSIMLDDAGNAVSLELGNAVWWDWVQIIDCLTFGPVNGISEAIIDDINKADTDDIYKAVSHLSTEILVSLFRKLPDMYDAIMKKVEPYDKGVLLYNMMKGIVVIVKAYDTGAIDADGVSDIMEHASDPAYVMENYGPDMMDTISSVMGVGRRFDTRSIAGLPDLPDVVSGKSMSAPGEYYTSSSGYFDTDDEDVFSEKSSHVKSTPAGIRIMSSPAVQQKLYKTRGLTALTGICSEIATECGYCIPIDQNLMRVIFRSGHRTQNQMAEIVSLYNEYINKVMDNGTLKSQSRNVERIMDDVRRYITPRVQRELCLAENGGMSHDDSQTAFKSFARWVPGFIVDPIIADRSAIFDYDSEAMNNVPTTAFIAYLRRVIPSNKAYVTSGLIMRATSPVVLDDIFHKTPQGLRVLELMLQILNNPSHLSRIFGDIAMIVIRAIDNEARAKKNETTSDDNGKELVEKFLSTYIVPNRAKLTDCITLKAFTEFEHLMNGSLATSDGFTIGVKTILEQYNTPNGKKPSIASMLFMSRGSWFDFSTRAWTNGSMEVMGEAMLLSIISTCWPLIVDNDEISYVQKGLSEYRKKIYDTMLLVAVSSLAGRNVLRNISQTKLPLTTKSRLLNVLFAIDRDVTNSVGNGGQIVSDSDFDEMIGTNPKMLLVVMSSLSPERKARAEEICFSPAVMESLSETLDGMRLLLELGQVSGLHGFSKEFILSHRNKISDALDMMVEMGNDEAEIADIRNQLFGSSRKLQQEGGKVNDSLLGRVEYSVANGIRWMTGFVKIDSNAGGMVQSPNGKCTLFSREGVEALLASLGKDSPWRLPTPAELENLGSAETIAKLGLGFSNTGKADDTGRYNSIFDSGCYAWYSDKGRLGGYSVTYDVVDIDDSDIEEGDWLAVKLVSWV